MAVQQKQLQEGVPSEGQEIGFYCKRRVEQLGSPCGTQYHCENSQEQGVEPAPERNKKTSWREFLQAHWQVLAAADFFTVEVWTLQGLRRYLVFFVIELSTRRIRIAGIAPQPNAPWMAQMARNFTDVVDVFLLGKRLLLHDRDPLFTSEFTQIPDCRRERSEAAAAIPEPERLCGAVCPDDQGILPGSSDLLRRS